MVSGELGASKDFVLIGIRLRPAPHWQKESFTHELVAVPGRCGLHGSAKINLNKECPLYHRLTKPVPLSWTTNPCIPPLLNANIRMEPATATFKDSMSPAMGIEMGVQACTAMATPKKAAHDMQYDPKKLHLLQRACNSYMLYPYMLCMLFSSSHAPP